MGDPPSPPRQADPDVLRGESILAFALDRWDDVPRSRHHVMSRLARTNRVLFVSPPTGIRRVLRHAPADAGRLRRVGETLHTYVPSRWLPYTDRSPRLDAALAGLRHLRIRHLMRRLGMSRPILYLWHPFFAGTIGAFGEKAIAYHCYDEYVAFKGVDRERVSALERRILERADVVFAVSEGLRAEKARVNRNAVLIRNAVDFDLFSRAQAPETPIAPEVARLPRPVIGCVTRVVPEYFDAELLREVFARRPDWSFVVIGPELASASEAGRSLQRLKALPNVHLLGRRDLPSLPSYLKGVDACLIPYVLSENKLLADPLKVYEYLAAGKPVISKRLPTLAWLGEAVAGAEGADEWVAAIEQELNGDSPARIARRQEIARANTWDDRIRRISAALSGVIQGRP
jgi:glycosyltransferase involved in cell wall biosynthesis